MFAPMPNARRRHGNQREAWRLPHHPRRVAQVLPQSFHRYISSGSDQRGVMNDELKKVF
ncbi:MAG: hypothetical protein WKF84_09740 [Pyrinomonadaceae bacterium]